MTQDEIIEMAIQSQLAFDSEEYPEIWQTYMNVGKQEIETFANLVAAKEREACAILCDNRSSFYWNWQAENLQKHEENRHYAKASEECADAIRARGEQA